MFSSNKFLKVGAMFLMVVFLFGGKITKAAETYYDLSPAEILITPDNPVIDKNFTITVKVKNAGTKNIDSLIGLTDFKYKFNNFSVVKSTLPAPTLTSVTKPGEYLYYYFEGGFNASGEAVLEFTADNNNELAESNENNNAITKKINVLLSRYDLLLEDIIVSPAGPAVNQKSIITVKAKNNGVAGLFDNAGLNNIRFNFANFSSEDTVYPNATLSNIIKAGEYFYYTFTGKFTKAGEALLTFSLDDTEQLTEQNETNNYKEKKATVKEKEAIDLTAEKISLNIKEPIINERMEITVTVANRGGTSLTNAAGLESDAVLANFPYFEIASTTHDIYPSIANPLDPNEIFKYGYIGQFNRAGDHNLIFGVDKNIKVAEINKNNNSTSTIIKIFADKTERDDFKITDIRAEIISSTSVMVVWKTDKPTIGKVSYRQGAYQTDQEASSSGEQTSHAVTLSKLAPNRVYDYKIIAAKASVTKISNYQNFSTPTNDAVIATTEPKVLVELEKKTLAASWSTNLKATGAIYYRHSGEINYKKAAVEVLSLHHEIKLENLAGGEYDYWLNSTSSAGTVWFSPVSAFTIPILIASTTASTTTDKVLMVPPAVSTISGNNQPSSAIDIKNNNLYQSLRGKIILKVESAGEAYYVNPQNKQMYFLNRPADAYKVMRNQGTGISNKNLAKIPVGLVAASGADTDNDGLADILEEALETDKNKQDTDGDGYTDKQELQSDYSPFASGGIKLTIDSNFSNAQKGKILLQVEGRGEAWYVNPADGRRYFLGRPADAFQVMRLLGTGVSNNNFSALQSK
ncbi:hypothetical protein COU00_01015 [Candidatus Falkowbacteria bacterium CG10_big_fil_rev_8_21_14_0_10_43_11]|uniref:CARDB domain-containing protein n=1 Tax=Candidatus Falkowbacteria bacterium CG10_big_fil_rev_8_21_14_0_10_43_11 TaxID=1974568 RepID=A0A2M6WMP5_9BACT|nr:MAG: hypothetical protein COU00_01015 [Candidatus Falkowbacteria bacterium CG10_big_fil_rev_8_21_14_0_10_43_11]